ncbi:MAG: outer membrane protein transport protein [Verrucomicrobiota bacterium]
MFNHFGPCAIVAGLMIWSARAEGFRNPPPGAFSLGRAGGRIAHIDDASAVTHNPANIVDLAGPQFSVSPSLVYIHIERQATTGTREETTDPWKLLPNLFVSLPIEEGKWAAGLAITTPYGLSNEWEHKGSFAEQTPLSLRYNAPHFTELKTINVNPAIAYQFNDQISLAAGLDVFWSELTIKQFYPWAFFPGGSGEGNAKIKGDGFGFGGNAALTWRFHERHRLAFTVRTPVEVEYDGSFKIDNIPATAMTAGATPRSDMRTEIDFPTIVAIGYGIQLSESVRLEADVEWLQFSRFRSLDLDLGSNGFLFPSTSVRQDWNDTFTAGLGGDWRFAPDWVLRASYQFYESPVPDETFTTTIPDGNQQVFTAGLGYQRGRHAFEIAYGGIFYDDRHIARGSPFDGDYQMLVHLFSLAYTFSY